MLADLNEIELLFIRESKLEEQIKKVIFVSISIVLPILEIIIIILQTKNIFETSNDNDLVFKIFIGFLELCSIFCTWGLISICFNNMKGIIILLAIKIFFIFIFILIISNIPFFKYYLTFDVILYGIFFTLIFIYKSFRKSIL